MRNVLALAAFALMVWYSYSHQHGAEGPDHSDEPTALKLGPADASRCDGRTRCSQMTSCEEATYFLRNCPDTTMDGDHDGVPCEQQWCNEP
jgi:hypothetical protein